MGYVRWLVLALVVGAALAVASPSGVTLAASFTVNSTADAVDASPGDGTCATAGGACTLRAAIQETNALLSPDTISLPAGVYTLSIPGAGEDAAATGDLDITDSVIVNGAGAGSTIIDGGDLDRVLHILPPDGGDISVELAGVTIQNGTAVVFDPIGAGGTGGGIFIGRSATLTLTDVTVTANWASHGGGGIHNGGNLTMISSAVTANAGGVALEGEGGGGMLSAGTATLIDSVVSANTSQAPGGGISGGALTLINSTVSGNSSTEFSGGGIFGGDSVTLSGSIISSNTAKERGGGILGLGSITITDSTISGNTAALLDGGGIANDAGSLTLANVTVSGNSAETNGGGIANGSGDASPVVPSTLTLTNVTISGNDAGDNGGGIYNGGGINSATASLTSVTVASNGADGLFNNPGYTITLTNTIVAGSEDGNCTGAITSGGHNLEDDDTCGLTAPGDLVNGEPNLSPLADNGGPTLTHALMAGSPAIDAGDSGGCPETDQRGVDRPLDGDGDGDAACDIGAYEAAAAVGITPTPAPTPTPTPVATAEATPKPTPALLPVAGGEAPGLRANGTPVMALAGVFAGGPLSMAGLIILRRCARR